MDEEKKYYKYEFVFGSKDIKISEMDYYENETLNETNVFINNDGVYRFYMYSDSKYKNDTFLYQISKILCREATVASHLYHLASGRVSAFNTFWNEYNEKEEEKDEEFDL